MWFDAHRYGAVLALALVVLVFVVAAPEADWARAVAVVLQGGTLFVVAITSGARPGVVRVAAAGVVVAVAATVLGTLVGNFPNGVAQIMNGAFAAAAPAVIAGGIVRDLRDRGVTAQAVAGALAVYLLLGLFFAFLIGAITDVSGSNYFSQGGSETQSDRVYFSFTTLTTTGFGDLTAATQLGRAVTVLEMLLGQAYLVTVVAVLVSRLGTARAARTSGTD